MTKSNEKKRFSRLIQPRIHFVLGVSVWAATKIVVEVSVGPLSFQDDSQPISWLIQKAHYVLVSSGFDVSYILLATGLFTLLVNIWAKAFWHENVKPIFQQFLDQLTGSTNVAVEDIRSNTELVSTHIQRMTSELSENIKENNLDLAIGHAPSESLAARLSTIYEKVYGQHCSREKGLYQYVGQEILKYLDPRLPHWSNYYQEITIEQPEGKTIWKEETSYHLHTIALDREFSTPFDGGIENYILTHATVAKYTDIEHVVLEVYVDDGLRVSTKDQLKRSQDGRLSSDSEAIGVEQNGDLVTIRISLEIPINEPMTAIRIVEESVLDDTYFVSRIFAPTFNFRSNVTLPDGWEFEFFHAAQSSWEGTIQKASKRSLHKAGWVIPGMIFCCRWVDSNSK